MSALAKLEKIWKMKKLKLKGKFHLFEGSCEQYTAICM